MPAINQMSGLREVIQNVHYWRASSGMGCARGLKKAGLLLQRASQKRVPVDFGVLKASAFTRATGIGYATVVTVGYTARYALEVHESVGMRMKGKPRRHTTDAYEQALQKAREAGVPPPAAKPPGYGGHYWDPQGKAEAKFLEKPMKELLPRMRAMIELATRTGV